VGRSTKKGPYVDAKLQKKVQALNKNREKRVVKTWARACTITPEFVGHTFAVHNGHKFITPKKRLRSRKDTEHDAGDC
jgi:small subunit ribosomal protein S19